MAGAWQKMADLFDLFRGGTLYSDGGPLTAAPLDGGPPPRPHFNGGLPTRRAVHLGPLSQT
jgi:hypothetical protein